MDPVLEEGDFVGLFVCQSFLDLFEFPLAAGTLLFFLFIAAIVGEVELFVCEFDTEGAKVGFVDVGSVVRVSGGFEGVVG